MGHGDGVARVGRDVEGREAWHISETIAMEEQHRSIETTRDALSASRILFVGSLWKMHLARARLGRVSHRRRPGAL